MSFEMSNVNVQTVLGFLCCSYLNVPDYKIWARVDEEGRRKMLLRPFQCQIDGFVGGRYPNKQQ